MNLSLAKLNFINIFFTALAFTVIIGIFSVEIINDSYSKRIESLEKSYIEKNKKLAKEEVFRAINRIDIIQEISFTSLQNTLEEKVDIAYDLLSHDHNLATNIQLISHYRSVLDTFKWDKRTGYFYIFDTKGKILYHGANSALENKNIFPLIQNNPELQQFIHTTMKKDTNFGSYPWFKPNETKSQLFKKYVFAKKLKKYNLYIAAGIYKSEFQKKVQSITLKELEKERFGDNNYGYFWVHRLDDTMIMHPNQKELENQDLTNFKSVDGQFLFQNMNKLIKEKNGGYISYIWYKPNTTIQDEKISYIHRIKNTDLVIGSGFYLTELKELLQEEKNQLNESLQTTLQKIFTSLLLLMIVTMIIAWLLSKKIQKVEIAQIEHLNMLEQYQLILDKSAVVSKTTLKGIVTYVNESFVQVSGYSKNEILGKPHNLVRHPETPKSQFKELWNTIKKGEIWHGIIKNRTKDGDSYFNNTTIVPIKNSEGEIIEYISSASDVTEIFENRTKLQSIFKTDPLTGLGNRVSLIDTITKDNDALLALINIDRFKEINDIQGHEIGDMIIQELGQRIYHFLEDKPYTTFRVQADIFAIFTKEVTLDELLSTIKEFMKTLGNTPFVIEENSFILTYSCGIAQNSENLLTYADIALSEAKNKKLQIKVFDPSMNNIEEYKHNILWVKKLHTAISEDKIVPYFQPIYNYHTGKIEKYEALMRLIEDGDMVSPEEYLSIAKKTKLYPELTYKMSGKVITKFANEAVEFSINLSIEDLMNEKLMQFIYNYAEQKDVFSRMVLEIVESEEMQDSDQISTTIQKFKDVGCKVAIDDFGSGYSNYDYLISLQADYIKIDGSITKHVLEDERTAEVIKSIVKFAKKSNMKTIAEFVSSKEVDEKVRELGVDYAQGWYYGKAEKELL